MELPINDKDLSTIVSALSLGGDTRLYFLLKNIREDRKMITDRSIDFDPNVKIFSESDEYQCKQGECDI